MRDAVLDQRTKTASKAEAEMDQSDLFTHSRSSSPFFSFSFALLANFPFIISLFALVSSRAYQPANNLLLSQQTSTSRTYQPRN